ncbi:GNAT family N-acetyltransferase [Piscinibacter gummiphilus]|nr:GNAT family N-acetyltransferase [Piscinibacter gummiphilus]GLS95323.1 N-acetyltransferase GCN5 [Piscinibacter gummiphilus]
MATCSLTPVDGGPDVMKIATASVADAEEISALIVGLSEPFFLSPSREGAEPFLASIAAEAQRGYLAASNFTYRVARAGARIVGVVALRDNAHLFHLFVAEDFQGRGLARRLWQLVESEALQAGNPGVFTVNASLDAVPLYEKFGFARVGEVQRVHGVSFQPMKSTP